MLLATTGPALLVLALTLGLTALSMMDGEPQHRLPMAVVSGGGDN